MQRVARMADARRRRRDRGAHARARKSIRGEIGHVGGRRILRDSDEGSVPVLLAMPEPTEEDDGSTRPRTMRKITTSEWLKTRQRKVPA